ncbi:basic form of pathogenesis-related protein 1-like [Heracleum sosnowskyi]|uniref:Basic form of pathogenesis-related protein 1-like n=1 Tax=Heracleum sosnowskyi TaxID=360622 RepID=A0AAD8NBW0_9APIA|nr:basic form of pathogenesis-related protein 1-like [Heracleum sosnowskyi]
MAFCQMESLDEELKETRQITRFENWSVILSISKLAFPLHRPVKSLSKASYHIDPPACQDFLDVHNKARAEVGVAPLKWNDAVAAYAQNYAVERAEDCKLQHSDGAYGENIAEASWDLSPIEAVKMWVDEKPFFDYSSNKCNGGDCLHYTQVVWRNSVSVGCAKVQCRNNQWYFVTCNYDPPGNFIGERPY